uniref:ATP-grasp domain-containing protein n=1 Tax=Succinivibrio sp. TaxID=2053619 RepID=UPI00402A9508
MNKINILVSAISGDVANGILKCLQNYEHVKKIIGCDIYQYPCGLNKVTKFYKISPCIQEQIYLNELLDICSKENIDLFIPTNEFEIYCISKNRGLFFEKGIKLLIHPKIVYEIFFDKYNTQKKLQQLNLPYIPTYFADEYNQCLNFPIVVKDIFNSGSKNIRILNDASEMRKHDNLTHNQIVQPYIGTMDQEYTVPVFSFNDGSSIACIPFRRTLSKSGYTNYIEPVSRELFDKIYSISSVISKTLQLNGSIDLQMRMHKNELYIFECNPRLSGTVNFRHKLGFQDALWWIDLMFCFNSSFEFEYPTNFVGVRELNEEIFRT